MFHLHLISFKEGNPSRTQSDTYAKEIRKEKKVRLA